MSRSSMLRRMLFAAAFSAALFVPMASANAGAATFTASSGNLRTTFSYTGHFPQAKNERLVITESNKVLYDRPVSSKWCGSRCWPLQLTAHSAALHLVHLQSSGPASVVLGLYSGGAHCCSIEQVFSFDAHTMRFEKIEHNFGDPGVRVVPIGPDADSVFFECGLFICVRVHGLRGVGHAH